MTQHSREDSRSSTPNQSKNRDQEQKSGHDTGRTGVGQSDRQNTSNKTEEKGSDKKQAHRKNADDSRGGIL